jgi:hypothetical protein
MITPLSKITIKKVYGIIKTKAVTITDPVTKEKREILMLETETPLMRVYGQASGFRVAESQYGESAVFKGIFKAVNIETGEIFSSGECCLPRLLENQLSGVLGSENAEAVEFGFDVLAVPAKNAYGYEYKVQPLMETVDAPIITALEQKLGMLALPNKTDDATNTGKAIPKGKGKGK